MSCTIHNCSYDPAGGNNYKAIDPLAPLQKSGSLDISYLIHEIAEKDFGYNGTEKYTLTLQNSKMVLEIWDRPDGLTKHEFGTLTLNGRQWKLTKPKSSDVPVLKDPAQISNRVNHTLSLIRQAYESANTSSIPSSITPPMAPQIGSASLNITSASSPAASTYNHPDHTETLSLLLRELRTLQERLSKLEQPLLEQPLLLKEQHVEDLQRKVQEQQQLLENTQNELKRVKEDNERLIQTLQGQHRINQLKESEQKEQQLQDQIRQLKLQLEESQKLNAQIEPLKKQLEEREKLLKEFTAYFKKYFEENEEYKKYIEEYLKGNEEYEKKNNQLKINAINELVYKIPKTINLPEQK